MNGSRSPVQGLLSILIPLTLIGLTVADFARDGQIDKYLIGALMVFGLGALGYRIDVLLEKWLDSKNRGGGSSGPSQ